MSSNDLKWNIETLRLKLKYNWKISRNSSLNKDNLIIKVNNTPVGEAAPNIRFNQTSDLITEEFNTVRSELPNNLGLLPSFLEELKQWNISNCLKCALEMSCWNLSFNRKKTSCLTSYSIPILPLTEYENFFNEYDLNRFKIIKLKASQT